VSRDKLLRAFATISQRSRLSGVADDEGASETALGAGS